MDPNEHYPADPLAPNQHNDKVVLQLGNDLGSAINITLPDAAWQRTGNNNALDCATIVWAGGHGAGPPVYRSGPHAGGTANTGNVRVRRAALLPSQVSVTALLASPNGLFSHRTFHTQILQPEIDSGDAARINWMNPVVAWF